MKKAVYFTMAFLILFIVGATISILVILLPNYPKENSSMGITKKEGVINSKEQNKVWLAIGDSITYGEGNNGLSYADYIAMEHHNITMEKRALGGMKTDELVLYSNTNGFISTDNTPDIVTVLMGTNDFGTSSGLSKYENDLQSLIDLLKSRFSTSRIIFLTPPYRDYYGDKVYILRGMVNQIGENLYEYNNVLKNKASANGIEIIELNEEEYFNKDNLKRYTVDGLHPNAAGNKLMADKIYKSVMNN